MTKRHYVLCFCENAKNKIYIYSMHFLYWWCWWELSMLKWIHFSKTEPLNIIGCVNAIRLLILVWIKMYSLALMLLSYYSYKDYKYSAVSATMGTRKWVKVTSSPSLRSAAANVSVFVICVQDSERKGFMDRLYAIQDVFISVQNALDEVASYGERIKKWVLCSPPWDFQHSHTSVPYMSFIIKLRLITLMKTFQDICAGHCFYIQYRVIKLQIPSTVKWLTHYWKFIFFFLFCVARRV